MANSLSFLRPIGPAALSRRVRFFSAWASVVLSGQMLGAVGIEHLRCEYLVDPLGIDATNPRLSWVVTSPERGEKQTAWQILVASSPEILATDQGDLWDSGKIDGDTTSHICYQGTELESRSECYWKVRVWDKGDEASAWSSPARWTVGLLNASDWSAKWIDGAVFGPEDDGVAPPTIVLARYEGITSGSGFRDVTALLTSMVAEGNYSLSVTNDAMGGDPAYNTVKQLRVVYQRGEQTYTKTFAEDTTLVIPADLPRFDHLAITGARYESTTGTVFRDVTATLNSRAANGAFSLVVNNTSLGPDPAPGQVKRLRVSYTIDGVSQEITKAETATFRYPEDLQLSVPPTIVSARYEALDGTGWTDVTQTLNTRAANGAYTLMVNNSTLGGDPAPNRVKRLRIILEKDGDQNVRYVEEERVFNYPSDLDRPTTVPYLRRSFAISKPVRKAVMHATALGLYEMHLNGTRVGDHILAPEWTDYRKRLNYQEYDVTSQLVGGANVLGAQLANGWYSGRIGNGYYQFWGTSPALLAQLEIFYQDGTRERIITDGSWKMAPSPMIFTDFMLGEDYDARREVSGWSTAAVDDSSWGSVLLRREQPVEMSSQRMEPVKKLMEIKPLTLNQPKPGKWTYDMGQNMVGVLRIKLNAAAGTKVTLRHAEMLNPDGTVYTANLRGAPSIDTYICKGGGEETWMPSFTFHGFQYVELTGVSAPPTLDTITGVVFGSDTPRTGTFTSSDGFINQLQSNIEWGQRGNYLSVPTDCPQRDERLGWLGDAQVFVRTATYNSDIAAFFTKWLKDVDDSKLPDGRIPDVVPSAVSTAGAPAWNDAITICPWTIYQAYGDKQILEDCYPAMKGWVEYCRTNSTNSIRDRGRGQDYGDWLSIDADTNKELIATGYYAYSTRILSKAAAVLGKTSEAASYEALFQTIRTAFNNKYVNQTTGEFIGTGTNTQCAYAMALKFELLSDTLRPLVAQRLENNVVAKGDHLSTGFVGVSYLLPMLTREGKNEKAYDLLMQDTFPSWLFSVKLGATTIWERWDGWTPERGFQSTIMNSFNHYSLGSCGEWLYETVAGIGQDPLVPAFKKIVIRPQPGGPITSASGSFYSMQGLIKSSWRKYDGGFTLDTEIPVNATADVHVPAVSAADVKESGQPVADIEGVDFLRMENGAAVFSVVSGRYRFTSGAAEEPGVDDVSRDAGAPLKIRISTLLANDGGIFELTGAGPLSVNGASITVDDEWIYYTPSATSGDGTDSFTYTIRGEDGGITSRTVRVGIIPADAPVQKVLSIVVDEAGKRVVNFSGVPGRIYRIQSSETMSGPDAWTTRLEIQAAEDGTFSFTDELPLPAARFYRAVFP